MAGQVDGCGVGRRIAQVKLADLAYRGPKTKRRRQYIDPLDAIARPNGLSAEQMDPRFEIITAPDVIDLLMGATGSLQIS